jgi:tetratricopeptide (TPR) repeat protein
MATFPEAVELEKAGKLNEAYTVLQQLSQSTPPASQVWTHMAAILLVWNRAQEALNTFEYALRLDPRDPYAWEGKARALLALSRKQEALQAADQALRLRPDLIEALFVKGKVLASFDDVRAMQQGIACFDQILSRIPTHLAALTAKITALLVLRRWNEAKMAGDQALALDPANRQAWRAIAMYHWERREFPPALSALERAIQLARGDDTLWTLKGGILRNQYTFDHNKTTLNGAIAAFDEALRLKPGDPDTIQARREALAVQRGTSLLWSTSTITTIWLGGWALFFVAFILAASSGGTSGGTAAVTLVGIVSAAAILVGWGMALIRSAQEGRWFMFMVILLLGNFLGPIIIISWAVSKATQLARS